MMLSSHTRMPRNVDAIRAAAILYGDWGTSKAYVIGLAFALAGHASFWLIALVGGLNVLVALNYITICKYYPCGGGVYASAQHHSKILALVGAFFLIADYIVTAALSALAAFFYFGVPNPELWAIGAIACVGAVNFLGPRSSSNLAIFLAVPTVTVMVILALLCLPQVDTAVRYLEPLQGNFTDHWLTFVSIIVALSGIESIANITGVMKLDKGSTPQNPCVSETARKAILWVTCEVVVLTTLFALAVNAIPGLTFIDGTVNAPGEPDVRDYMLRYMGRVFGSDLFGSFIGEGFSYLVSGVIGILLLSAVNTALVALESLLFVVAADRELPSFFRRLNQFGVPAFSLLAAILFPIALLLRFGDIAELADLYAVGFIGAIATNLGATSLNFKLPIRSYERAFMFVTFLIMLAIELTLLFAKPHAANYVIAILAIGLFLRGLVVESYEKKAMSRKDIFAKHKLSEQAVLEEEEAPGMGLKSVMIAAAKEGPHELVDTETTHMHMGSFLCAVTHVGKTLEFAVEEAKKGNQLLYVLFIREQRILSRADREREWWEDEEACQIVDHLARICMEVKIKFLYSVSDSVAYTIVETAQNSKASRLILGISRKNRFQQLLQGNFISRISKILPSQIDLIIVS